MSDHAKPTWLSPRDVARLTGVSTDTLRHYETRGVLPAPSRSPAGYRRYAPETVTRVQLIQRALRIGFSIDDLTTVYRQRDRGGVPCQRVHHLVAERLEQLDREIAELTDLRKDLSTLLAEWTDRLAATPPGRQARLLDLLADRPSLTPPEGPRRRFGRASAVESLNRRARLT
jgi:DNA-binding transcriptional MerR regulator